MPTLLSLWPLSGLLILGACQQQQPEPTPEPELTGTWEFRAFATYRYDAQGTPLDSSLVYPVKPGAYLVVTDTTLQKFASDGTPYSPLRPYTRSGKVLLMPQSPATLTTLTTLTATTLAIRERHRLAAAGPVGYTAEEQHYVRR